MASSRIKGITIELNAETKALSSALKDVDSQSKKTASELKDVNKLLKFDPSNTELLAQKQKLLAEQIQTTETRLSALKTAQSQIKVEDVGEDKYRALAREIASTETELKGYKSALSAIEPEQTALNTNTKRLQTYLQATNTELNDYSQVLGTRLVSAIKDGTASSDQLELALNKIGKEALGSKADLTEFKEALDKADDGSGLDEVKSDLKELGTDAETAGGKLEDLDGKLSLNNLQNAAGEFASIGQNILQFGENAYSAFTDYDSGVDTIIKKTGATGDAVDQFSEIYDNLVNSVAVTDPYEKAGSAIGELNTQFGFTGDTLESMSADMMKFAEINDADVTESVQNAEQAISSFGLSSQDLPSVLDSVTAAAQQTGASTDTIFQSCINGSGALQSLGLDFNSSAMLMGEFTQSGVDAETAVKNLNSANVNFAKDGKTMSQGLSELQDVINSNASEQEKLAAVSAVVGSKASANFLKLAEDGKLNFNDLASSASDSMGSVDSTFDSITGSDEKLELALQNVKSAFAELGGVIADALTPILEAITPLIKNIADWFASLPGPVQQIIVIFTALVAVFGLMAPVILAVVVAVSSLDVALLPIIGIVLGIIAAITVIIVIIQNWGSICVWFSALWTTIWDACSATFSSWSDSIHTIWTDMQSWLTGKVNDLKNGVTSTFTDMENSVVGTFTGIRDSISNAMQTAFDNVSSGFQKIKDVLSGTLSFPNIKLPHFSITGSFSLNPPKVPSFGVDWYAKGGILTKPTIFGSNGGNLMGGGEAGAEAVAPISTLQSYVQAAVDNSSLVKLLSMILDRIDALELSPEITIDGKRITKVISDRISKDQNNDRKAGGY